MQLWGRRNDLIIGIKYWVNIQLFTKKIIKEEINDIISEYSDREDFCLEWKERRNGSIID